MQGRKELPLLRPFSPCLCLHVCLVLAVVWQLVALLDAHFLQDALALQY